MKQRKDNFSTLHEERLPKDLYREITNHFGPNEIVVIVTTRNPRRRLAYAVTGSVKKDHEATIRRATNAVHDIIGVS